MTLAYYVPPSLVPVDSALSRAIIAIAWSMSLVIVCDLLQDAEQITLSRQDGDGQILGSLMFAQKVPDDTIR